MVMVRIAFCVRFNLHAGRFEYRSPNRWQATQKKNPLMFYILDFVRLKLQMHPFLRLTIYVWHLCK